MNAILVKVQFRLGYVFLDGWFSACPRVDEYVEIDDTRYRVCQVRHKKQGQQFVPHVVLQEERR